MTRTRTEFPESVKRAALERAGYRCQDKLCGRSGEWFDLRMVLVDCESIVLPKWLHIDMPEGPATLANLIALRDAIMAARFKHRALRPIIKRFKLDGGALLEVDHEREDADGGTATLDNAMVRCVFCHLFKTLERARHRPKAGSKLRKKPPEQLDVIHTAKVEGLRQQVARHIPGKVVRVDPDGQVNLPALHRAMSTPILAPEPEAKPRRHTSESAFQAAAQRRERAILDNDGFFGA